MRSPPDRVHLQNLIETTPTDGAKLPYLPGLDGLCALAVLAVLLYHAELPAFPGGFLGVEVFFVISGYLVTALLLTEWWVAGHIAVLRFWLRRARRRPALFVVLAVTLSVALLFLPEAAALRRGDGLTVTQVPTARPSATANAPTPSPQLVAVAAPTVALTPTVPPQPTVPPPPATAQPPRCCTSPPSATR